MFRSDFPPTGSGFREIIRKEVDEILQEAEDKHLVTRPFRNEKNMSQTDGICFCCDDCCGYFLNPQEKCDKGKLNQKTDREICNNCGDCAQVCYFKARQMNSEELTIDQNECYGCALCQDVYPLECIEMVQRI
jgi:Pyruvate/2-oxoacid:ferredoxin oxidoreductase delta subunit